VRFAAKPSAHRAGIASALGLRAWDVVFFRYTAERLHKGDMNNAVLILAV
jgi:hypothetical protein